MNDENTTSTAPESDTADATSAWSEVVDELEALGDAVARWAKAAVNDPETRRRAAELKSRFEGLASEVGETLKDASDTDLGQSVKAAAEKTGETLKAAGEKVSAEVGPRLSSTFRAAADKLRSAAARIEERTESDDAGPEESGEDATPGSGPSA